MIKWIKDLWFVLTAKEVGHYFMGFLDDDDYKTETKQMFKDLKKKYPSSEYILREYNYYSDGIRILVKNL